MRIFLRILSLAGMVLATPLGAAPLDLTPDQMVAAASRSLLLGQPDQALALAQALLARNPDDLKALLLKARALRDLGRNTAARDAAERAWALARDKPQRFTAALVMAQVTSSSGNRTLAQFWLRRAEQNATTDEHRALARRDFRYVKSRNPLSVNLSFGASPSSNINGGANTDTITLFGLPFDLSPDAQALSGYQAQVSADLSYRIAATARSETRLGLQVYSRWSWLSAEAAAFAPGVSGSDFDYQSAALTLDHDRAGFREGDKLQFGLRVGRTWYGGAPLSDFASGEVTYQMPVAQRNRLSLTARADIRPSTRVGEVQASLLRPNARGDTLRFSASFQRAFSPNAYQVYGQGTLGVDLFQRQPVLGMGLSAGVELGAKRYPNSRYDLDGRNDLRVAAHANLSLDQISYYGFSPVVTLRAERAFSNVPLYSNDLTAIELGFRSNF